MILEVHPQGQHFHNGLESSTMPPPLQVLERLHQPKVSVLEKPLLKMGVVLSFVILCHVLTEQTTDFMMPLDKSFIMIRPMRQIIQEEIGGHKTWLFIMLVVMCCRMFMIVMVRVRTKPMI